MKVYFKLYSGESIADITFPAFNSLLTITKESNPKGRSVREAFLNKDLSGALIPISILQLVQDNSFIVVLPNATVPSVVLPNATVPSVVLPNATETVIIAFSNGIHKDVNRQFIPFSNVYAVGDEIVSMEEFMLVNNNKHDTWVSHCCLMQMGHFSSANKKITDNNNKVEPTSCIHFHFSGTGKTKIVSNVEGWAQCLDSNSLLISKSDVAPIVDIKISHLSPMQIGALTVYLDDRQLPLYKQFTDILGDDYILAIRKLKEMISIYKTIGATVYADYFSLMLLELN